MAGVTPPGAGLQPLIDRLERIELQLRTGFRGTGTQRTNLVEQVQAAIANIGASVTTFLSGGFTTGGSILMSSGYLYTPAGYAFDITYTRRGAWLGNDGRLGWASSSITAKELIDTIPEPDALRILEISSHHYQRKVELAKRDDPDSDGYVGPTYLVATEWGAIAEELHDLGLWQVVVYEWDTVWDLRDVLDDDGEPIVNDQGDHLRERVPGTERRVEGSEPRPVGVHYELLGLLAIVAARYLHTEQMQLRREHDELTAQLREKGVL